MYLMKRSLIITDRSKTEIFFLSLAILLYLSRTAIPFLKFPFIPIYSGLILYSIFKFKILIIKKTNVFFRNYYLLILLATILFISFLLSDKLYLIIFKDVVNSVILLSFFFFLSLFITGTEEQETFFTFLLDLIVIFACLISVNSIASLLNIFSIPGGVLSTEITSDSGTGYLSVDNNFALLLVFFGLIVLVYKLDKVHSIPKIILIDLVILLFASDIFFSGSRRGLITLIVILGLMIIRPILTLIRQKRLFDKAVYISLSYLLPLIFIIIFFGCFIHLTSFTFKNKCLEFIGSKEPETTRRDISLIILKYSSAVNKNSTFEDVYRKIWSPNLNPYDPDSGWGTRIHKTVFPLTGKNVEIVPTGSRGYLMDKSCNSNTRAGNAYSFTIISNETVSVDKILEASVFCYVSTDFDGEWALISCEGATEGKKENEYDLKFKGTWQKLSLRVNCLEGTAPVYLYFSKFAVTDLSSLKGYVIYAFPEVKIREKADSILPPSEKIMKSSSESWEETEPEKSETSLPFTKSVTKGVKSTNYNNLPLAISYGYANYNTDRIIDAMKISDASYNKISILIFPLFCKNIMTHLTRIQ